MRQQLKIARLTPAVLIGVCHPAAALLLSAPSGLLGDLRSLGPQVRLARIFRGPAKSPFMSTSKPGPCELFIQPFSEQPLSPCAVLAVTQTQSSGLWGRGT